MTWCRGHGVFARASSSRGKGTVTCWALDPFDQVLSLRAAWRHCCRFSQAQVEEYAYLDAQGNYVLCWDLGRYMSTMAASRPAAAWARGSRSRYVTSSRASR